MTMHSLVERNCRDLSFIDDDAVHLIVTQPPAFGSLRAAHAFGRFAISDYADYLAALEGVWSQCERVLAPGGHLAFVASPVALSSEDLPLASDIVPQVKQLGFELRRSIRWNPAERVEPDASGFYGAPNQPCSDPPGDSQDVFVMRKPGERSVPVEVQIASRMQADFFAACSASVWLIPTGIDPQSPQRFPEELAERLVRMFSFAGDTVLDPFAGLGAASAAAMSCGRNSIAVETEAHFFESMTDRVARAERGLGEITVTKGPPSARSDTDHLSSLV